MKWIKLIDRMPEKHIDGSKVLVYRIMNEGQNNLAISILDTYMIKHCDKNETWWMALPENPK